MSPVSWLILSLVVLALVFAVRSLVRAHRKGECIGCSQCTSEGCPGGCASCQSRTGCPGTSAHMAAKK